MQRCLVSLAIREMQIETTVRYYFIPIRISKRKYYRQYQVFAKDVDKQEFSD